MTQWEVTPLTKLRKKVRLPQRMTLVARTAFGDLFLRDEAGAVFWLDTAVGKLSKVASSETGFREEARTSEKRSQWFAEPDFLVLAI
jgi:hypothetical protein